MIAITRKPVPTSAVFAAARARDRLIVTWNRVGVETFGPRGRTEGGAAPSRFLYDLPEDAVEGDRPSPEPGSALLPDDKETLRRRLDAFLSAQIPKVPLPADTSVRLVEIDDPAELRQGRRVHHERYGVGVVRSFVASRLMVSFGGGPPRLVPLGTGELHLVEE